MSLEIELGSTPEHALWQWYDLEDGSEPLFVTQLIIYAPDFSRKGNRAIIKKILATLKGEQEVVLAIPIDGGVIFAPAVNAWEIDHNGSAASVLTLIEPRDYERLAGRPFGDPGYFPGQE